MNSAFFYSRHFFDPIRRFRDIERFFENTLNISKTATRIKKVCWITKTRNVILRLLYSWHVFDPIRCFRDIELFGKIFSKTLNISKMATRIKQVSWIKMTRNPLLRPFYSRHFFLSDSPFSRYWAFLENTLNITKTASRIKKCHE